MAAAEKQLLAMHDMEEMVEYLKVEVPSWPVQELQVILRRLAHPIKFCNCEHLPGTVVCHLKGGDVCGAPGGVAHACGSSLDPCRKPLCNARVWGAGYPDGCVEHVLDTAASGDPGADARLRDCAGGGAPQ